ncbi:unnamed protein product, partial [Vitis vinifera]
MCGTIMQKLKSAREGSVEVNNILIVAILLFGLVAIHIEFHNCFHSCKLVRMVIDMNSHWLGLDQISIFPDSPEQDLAIQKEVEIHGSLGSMKPIIPRMRREKEFLIENSLLTAIFSSIFANLGFTDTSGMTVGLVLKPFIVPKGPALAA